MFCLYATIWYVLLKSNGILSFYMPIANSLICSFPRYFVRENTVKSLVTRSSRRSRRLNFTLTFVIVVDVSFEAIALESGSVSLNFLARSV